MAEHFTGLPAAPAGSYDDAESLGNWPGWATDGYARRYFEGGRIVDWDGTEEATRVGALRHAAFRLAAVNWTPREGLADVFPYFQPDAAPIEILNACCELAAHYIQFPEQRFVVVGAGAEQDAVGNRFSFRYSWARDFYGDLPLSVMGLIQRFIASPSPTGAKEYAPVADSERRRSRFQSVPGWGARTGGR